VGFLLETPGIYSHVFISLILKTTRSVLSTVFTICKEEAKLLLYGSKPTTQQAKKEKEKGWGERDQINTSF